MTSPLKIAARVEIDASQAPQGAAAARQAVASIGTEAERTETKLQKLINSSVGFSAGPANQNIREWTGALAAQGKSIDDLRAKYNPLFAVIREYKASQTEIRTLHAQGVLSLNEMTAAMQRNRQATLASIDAIKGRGQAIDGMSAGNRGFAAANIAYQAQDIAVTAAMGMSPAMIGLQQGTQLAGGYAGMSLKEAASTTATGLASLVSPVSLVAIGLTTAAAASIQFGSGMLESSSNAKKLDDALKNQAGTLELLKKQYGDFPVVGAGSIGGNNFILANARKQLADLEMGMKSQFGDYVSGLNNAGIGGSWFGSSGISSTSALQNLKGDQAQFAGPVNALLQSVKSGKTDLAAFNIQIDELARNLAKTSERPEYLLNVGDAVKAIAANAFEASGKYKQFADAFNLLKVRGVDGMSDFVSLVKQIGDQKGISKLSDEVIALGRDLVETNGEAETLRRTLQAIDREDTRSGLRDRRDLGAYVNRRDQDNVRSREQFDAEQQLTRARTNAERLAAIERQVRSTAYIDGDKDGGLQARVDKALEAERNRQNVEQRNAADERSRSLARTVESQREELSLVGQTGVAADVLRQQYALIAAVREEAARKGVPADEKEIELIRAKSAELLKLRQAQAAASLRSDASFEREQLGRSQIDARIAQQLRGAGLPVDLKSSIAEELRYNEVLKQRVDIWEEIRDTGRNAIDDIADSAIDGFDKIDDVFKNIGKSLIKEITTLGITNPLKNSIYGDTRPTLDSVDGVGGIFSALTGSKLALSANDNRAGGFTGLAKASPISSSGSAVDLASGLLGFSENGNNGDINAFLRKGGVDIDAAQTAWCAGFVNSSLKQIGITGTGALNANSFLDWGSKIDPSQVLKGDVLVQSRGLGANALGGHVGFATGASRWFDGQQQLEMLSGNSGDSVAKSWINASELQIRRATEASTALAGMASNTNVAAQGLGQLGNGFSSFGNNLAQVQPGTGGGGGLLGGLLGGIGKLFGGISPTSSFWAPNTTLGAILTRADGGMIYGPGGPRDDKVPVLASNGEFFVNAASTAKHRALLEMINADKLPRFADGGYYGTGAPIYAAANQNAGFASQARNAPIINNYGPSEVAYEETTDENGNRQPIITIGEGLAKAISQTGNPANRAMQKTWGLRPRKVAR